MKNMSLKKLIGFGVFCLFFFCLSAYTLFVIDARIWGWILLLVLFAVFKLFRISKYWQKFFPEADKSWGNRGKKLVVYILFVLLLSLNNRLARPDLKVSYNGTLVREFIREARNLPMMKGD